MQQQQWPTDWHPEADWDDVIAARRRDQRRRARERSAARRNDVPKKDWVASVVNKTRKERMP
jgi:hypothetical protein